MVTNRKESRKGAFGVWIVGAAALSMAGVMAVSAQNAGDAGTALAPQIQRLGVTVKTADGEASGTESQVWLVVSARRDDGGTAGKSIHLGAGAERGAETLFTANLAPVALSPERLGGVALVVGTDGASPDWEIEAVEIVGIDETGRAWVLADYTVEAPLRWLRSGESEMSGSPALPIPTLSRWRPQADAG